jgi:hypothetical protein
VEVKPKQVWSWEQLLGAGRRGCEVEENTSDDCLVVYKNIGYIGNNIQITNMKFK